MFPHPAYSKCGEVIARALEFRVILQMVLSDSKAVSWSYPEGPSQVHPTVDSFRSSGFCSKSLAAYKIIHPYVDTRQSSQEPHTLHT